VALGLVGVTLGLARTTLALAGAAFGLTGAAGGVRFGGAVGKVKFGGAVVVGGGDVVVGDVVAGGVVVAGGAVVAGGGDVVAGGVAAAQTGLLTVSWMKVTSALRARTLPSTVMFSVSVIWVRARIVPMKVRFVFRRNAELTFQKTLHGCAPFVKVTEDVDSTIRLPLLAAWKMKTAPGSPPPSSVRAMGPSIRMPELEL